jgi:hypothetical protein
VPGQDGGRAGRGVDLNQLKLDWITSKANRLKQRIIKIDIDFKNAFNSMSQRALGGDESVQHSGCRPVGSHLWQNDSVHGSRGSQMCDHDLPDRGNTRRSIFSPYLYRLHQCLESPGTRVKGQAAWANGVADGEATGRRRALPRPRPTSPPLISRNNGQKSELREELWGHSPILGDSERFRPLKSISDPCMPRLRAYATM